MAVGKSLRSIPFSLFAAIVLCVGCGNQSADNPENKKTQEINRKNDAPESPDWGSEVNLEEMIEMAREGRIVEIQWHVMPNVLRAQTTDGKIYHLRNENKGVDLRNTLIESGVIIGKGGVLFRHVF